MKSATAPKEGNGMRVRRLILPVTAVAIAAGTRGTTTVTSAEVAGEPGYTLAFALTKR